MICYVYILQNDYHNKVNYHLQHTDLFSCVVRTFKIYCLSSFQGQNTVLLTVVAMLRIKSPALICLLTGGLYPLTNTSHFPKPPAILLSVSMSWAFLDSTYKWDCTVCVFLCLTDFHLA